MTKLKFLFALRDKLSGLSQEDVEERLGFYSEVIEDRMEEGISEEEAVAAVGSVDEIAAQIIADIPRTKERGKPKRQLRAWEIVLLVLGSPVWVSLLIAVFAIGFSLYAVLWSVIISLWAVFGSVAACAFAGIFSGIVFAISRYYLTGTAMIGAGIVCAGLSILLFFGCKAATKGTLLLTKGITSGIKYCFVKKEEA